MNLEINILNEIIENINKSGSYEVPFKVIEEIVFIPTRNPYRFTSAQVLIWAVENRILYEYKSNGDEAIVRFYKKG